MGYVQGTEFGLLFLIPLFPFIGATINGLFGAKIQKRFGPAASHRIAILMPSLSFVVALIALVQLMGLDAAGGRALEQNLFPFIHVGFFDADLAFWFDPLSATLTLIITFIGTLIHIYATGYMKGDPGYWRFFTYLNLFMGMMLLLALGDNFMVMFIGWEGVGLCSYLLISFWYTDMNNASAGMKAFVVNRVGDFAFVLGLGFLFWGLLGDFSPRDGYYPGGLTQEHHHSLPSSDEHHGGTDHADVGHEAAHAEDGKHEAHGDDHGGSHGSAHAAAGHGDDHGGEHGGAHLNWDHEGYLQGEVPEASLRFNVLRKIIGQNEASWSESSPTAKTMWGMPLIALVCILLFIAATGKSAQIPLYVWLPDAMAGPTPVSGLIHAATMVTAGVYMVARLGFLFSMSPTAMTVVAVVGALTAFFAATIGLFQYDIKKVLAYSTVSQLGYMFIGVGIGAYWAGVYHLLTHALFKACLFLCSGSVILGCHHEQDMRWMGGLKKLMPSTHRAYLMACVMITTAPVFIISNGFYSKDEILWKAFDAGHLLIPGYYLWIIGALGAVCTSFYMWRSYYMTFTGEYRGPNPHAHHHHDEDHGHGGGLPHESPLSMTGVLTVLWVLAIASIALGFWPLLGSMIGSDALYVPLFERWLHPTMGEAMARLEGTWLSHDPHALLGGLSIHAWEIGLAAASVVLTLGSWFAARVLYKDARSQLPQRLLENKDPLVRSTYDLVSNKYWVDEVYFRFIVGPVRTLSALLANFDQKVIDGVVNTVGYIGRLIGVIDGFIDSLVVDGMVNGVAGLVSRTGDGLRATQTGRIQTYLVGAVVGAVVLVFINFMFFFLNG